MGMLVGCKDNALTTTIMLMSGRSTLQVATTVEGNMLRSVPIAGLE